MEPKTLNLEDLIKERDALIAQANMLNGAMQLTNALIKKLTPEEPPIAEDT